MLHDPQATPSAAMQPDSQPDSERWGAINSSPPLRMGLMAALHDEISAFLAHIQDRQPASADEGAVTVSLAGDGPSHRQTAQLDAPSGEQTGAQTGEQLGAQSGGPQTASSFVPGVYTVAGRRFHCLRWHGLELVVALAGVGKVAAATTASLMADRFGVHAMAFTGVAGGLAAGVQVGDVVLAQQLLQHDMDASPLFPRHEVPLTGITRFHCDPGLSQSLHHAALALLADLPQCVGADAMARHGLQQARVHRGLIVSGDRFVATNAEREALLAELPDALAVEMEGAAVAQVCHAFGLPLVVVRTVSDRADDDAHVDFPVFTREVASHYSAQLLRTWLDGLAATRFAFV